MENKQINISIDEGKPFFAHEASVNFNPLQFSIDFRTITPRNDLRSKPGVPSLQVMHNVVMVEPWHMVQLRDLLSRMVDAYEKEFGAIKKPKAVEAFEKKRKKSPEEKDSEVSDASTEVPTYFG